MDSTHQTPYSRGGTGGECAGGRATTSAVTRDASWQHAARQARLLSWLSLGYMSAEGAIAIIAAVIAGSVALLGFGLDSAIEGLASVIIVWRFTGTRTLSETAEARAQKAVAVTFFLLAPYIAYEAAATLIGRHHAETSWPGIGLSIASLIVMPALGVAKRRLGARLDSAANTLLGWWWLDPGRRGSAVRISVTRLRGHAQQTPVAASPVPPGRPPSAAAGLPSSSASTASQRCSPSWPQKVGLSSRTV